MDKIKDLLKKPIKLSDIKKLCSNLDYTFYGLLVIGIVLFTYWLYQIFGIYLFVAPFAYIIICLMGKIIVDFKND